MGTFEEMVEMAWNPDRVAGYLALHRPEKWRLVIEESPEWLARHPGGFGSSDRASVGENLRVNPARLADLVADIDPRTVPHVLDAVVAWWNWSVVRQTMQVPEDELPALFAEAVPDAALVLSALADVAGVPAEEIFRY